MNVEYAELDVFSHFEECVDLQKKIFDLPDKDVIPTLFLSMIARKDPFMGILVGAFKIEEGIKKLIGFSISIATNENNSIYAILTGVLPEYQNKMYGYGIICKVRELAIKNNITTIYTLYDPLESNLGRLYMQRFGFIGVTFKEKAYELNQVNELAQEIPNDKILVKWDPLSEATCNKIEGNYNLLSLSEALHKYSIAIDQDFMEDKNILVEIPENFKEMKIKNPELALTWRNKIQIAFNHYINNKGYRLTECISGKINKKRKTYYLLEKI